MISIGDLTYVDGVTAAAPSQVVSVRKEESATNNLDVEITMPSALGRAASVSGCVETDEDHRWLCEASTYTARTYYVDYDRTVLALEGTAGAQSATYQVTASLVGSEFTDTGTVSIRPRADALVMGLEIDPSWARNKVYVVVDNKGPSAAVDLVLTVSGYRAPVAGVVPNGCAWSGATVRCGIAALRGMGGALTHPGAAEFSLPAPADRAGLRFTARLTGLYPDPVSGNNTRAVTVPGGGGSGGAGSGGGSGGGAAGGAPPPDGAPGSTPSGTPSASPTPAPTSSPPASTPEALDPVADDLPTPVPDTPVLPWIVGSTMLVGGAAVGGYLWWRRRVRT
jgi:hypothetical protein